MLHCQIITSFEFVNWEANISFSPSVFFQHTSLWSSEGRTLNCSYIMFTASQNIKITRCFSKKTLVQLLWENKHFNFSALRIIVSHPKQLLFLAIHTVPSFFPQINKRAHKALTQEKFRVLLQDWKRLNKLQVIIVHIHIMAHSWNLPAHRINQARNIRYWLFLSGCYLSQRNFPTCVVFPGPSGHPLY